MKKIIIGIIVLAVVVWGGVKLFGTKEEKIKETIKIGAILPLSGTLALPGEFAKRGIELALEELQNENDIDVEVIFEDSKFDPKLGIGAYEKLKTNDNVKAILEFGSPVGMALSPLANKDKILLLGLVAAPPYSTPNDYTFRIVGSATAEANGIVDVLVNKFGKQKVAVLFMNNDYGKGTADAFKIAFKNKGEIIFDEGFNPQETDFRSQLTKIKATNLEALFLASLGREAGVIIKQAKELKLNNLFICAQACDNPDLIAIASDSADGLVITAPTDDANAKFKSLYQNKYKENPNYVSMRMYDATKILASVFNACKKDDFDKECLLKEMNNVKDFPGSSYSVNFDENGDINDQFILKTVKNGQFVKYEE